MSRKKTKKNNFDQDKCDICTWDNIVDSSEKLREIGEGRNLPYPFLRGQPLKEVVNPYLVFNKTVAYLFNDSTKLHEIWTEDRTYRVQKIDMTYKVPRPPVAMATSENCGSLSILWQTYLNKYIQ